MAIVPSVSESLYNLFPLQHRDDILQVYNRIPGTLMKFLEQQEVIEVINIDDTFHVIGTLGTEKTKSWDTFRLNLRSSIQSKLDKRGVAGIKAEELAEFLAAEYVKKCPNRAKRGENLSAIVQLNKSFSDQHHRYVNAYIYARITEECEDNWIATNQYKYSYYVSLDLKGIVINEKRALEVGELVCRSVPSAIQFIEDNCKLTWSGFTKK